MNIHLRESNNNNSNKKKLHQEMNLISSLLSGRIGGEIRTHTPKNLFLYS